MYICYLIVAEIWYRHSREPEIDSIPYKHTASRVDVRTIASSYNITHMYVESGHLPTLFNIAPGLTHLKLDNIIDPSQLER